MPPPLNDSDYPLNKDRTLKQPIVGQPDHYGVGNLFAALTREGDADLGQL